MTPDFPIKCLCGDAQFTCVGVQESTVPGECNVVLRCDTCHRKTTLMGAKIEGHVDYAESVHHDGRHLHRVADGAHFTLSFDFVQQEERR